MEDKLAEMKNKDAKQQRYDLEIQGSIGEFSIEKEDQKSERVLYLQTQLKWQGNNKSNPSMWNLLEHLDMFREFYSMEDMKFEELLQRDINDHRISTQMIPYILGYRPNAYVNELDVSPGGKAIFFPPIVGIAIPVDDGKPMSKYPGYSESRTSEGVDKNGLAHCDLKLSLDTDETPTAQFSWYQKDGVRFPYIDSHLKINTNNCQIVIIDGQHRAMTLLALHRNFSNKGWDKESRSPYKNYYSEWTKEFLSDYNFDQFEIPLIICSFPDCNGDSEGDIKKMARRLFVTLNKEAKKPSPSRRLLLEDDDIMGLIVRRLLNDAQKSSLPIWSIQLEGDGSGNPDELVAEISVQRLNHILCMALLRKRDELKDTFEQNMGTRYHILNDLKPLSDDFKNRLCGGFTQAQKTEVKRSGTPIDKLEDILDVFSKTYGNAILQIYSQLIPYSCRIMGSVEYLSILDASGGEAKTKRALYGGLQFQQNLKSYRKDLTRRCDTVADLEEKDQAQYENIIVASSQIETEVARIEDSEQKIIEQQWKIFTQFFPGSLDEIVKEKFFQVLQRDGQMGNKFAQYGFILSPFVMIEETLGIDHTSTPKGYRNKEEFISLAISEYIESMNNVFRLIGPDNADFWFGFFGETEAKPLVKKTDDKGNEILDSNGEVVYCFSEDEDEFAWPVHYKVLFETGSLKPELWPRMLHLVCSVWQTACPELQTTLDEWKKDAESSMTNIFIEKKTKAFRKDLKARGIPVTDPTPSEIKGWRDSREKLFETHNKKLSNLVGGIHNKKYKVTTLKEMCKNVGIDVGKKGEMIERLVSYFHANEKLNLPEHSSDKSDAKDSESDDKETLILPSDEATEQSEDDFGIRDEEGYDDLF